MPGCRIGTITVTRVTMAVHAAQTHTYMTCAVYGLPMSEESGSHWLRLMSRVASTRPAGWFFLHVTTHVDRRLVPLTRGRVSTAPGVPVLCLEVIGRRTGKVRRVPVVYQRRGDELVVVASAAGRAEHPAWFLNARAAGQVKVYAARGLGGDYHVRVAEGEERERLWADWLRNLPGFANYEPQIAGRRQLPIVVLSPTSTA